MCFQDVGVETFRKYKFIHSPWQSIDTQKKFMKKKSTLPNAGDGLFANKNFENLETILYVEGEPLERWHYHALDITDNMYSGLNVHVPLVGSFIWRAIPNTLGCTINSSKKDCNVEFIVNWKAIDHKNKNFNGDLFITVQTKKPILKGQELFVDYGSQFWKFFKKKQEDYCAICLKTNAIPTMVLCDGPCQLGYHVTCFQKLTGNRPNLRTKKWYCFNCM